MKQGPLESVADFAHRFLETQHALEKLVPGIHRPEPGNDLELLHAFAIKLKPEISTEMLSRDFQFPSLADLIEAAKRYELRVPVSPPALAEWQPTANFSSPSKPLKPGDKLCRNYNKFDNVHCELSNGSCRKGHIHRCSVCYKFTCKAKLHGQVRSSPPNPQNRSNSRANANRYRSNRSRNSNNSQNRVSSNVANTPLDSSENVDAPPSSFATPTHSMQDQHLFELPAIASPISALVVSRVDLASKNILWTKVALRVFPYPCL